MKSLKGSYSSSKRVFFVVISIQILVTILPECEAQGDSCGSRNQRSARLMKVVSCDLSVNDYCPEAGDGYPWRDMMKFVIENRAVMTRMYGELKESSVVEDEINIRTGRNMNIGRKVPIKGKEYIQYNHPKAPDKKKYQYTASYSSSEKPTTVTSELPQMDQETSPTPMEELNVTTAEIPFVAPVTEIIDEGTDESDEIITIFKQDSYFIAEQQLGERNEEMDMENLKYDTMKTIEVMKETESQSTTQFPSTTAEQEKPKATTTAEPLTTPTFRTTKSTTVPTSSADLDQEEDSEQYYDTQVEGSGDTWAMNYEPMSACQASIEYFTPYWANNTRGETLALINIHPYEQYVHSEKCVNLNQQDNCKEGCKCEQQYRLYRLLAYDPSNDCRGIFADWFRLPGCCICMCYHVPVTSPPAVPPNEFLYRNNISPHRQGRKSSKPIPLRYRKHQQ